ncbi:unnamed protein product [Durusdinium trenchii]|uniref:DNA (cytosine-5-)-methyltransferase n=1 Tax=Durusdinium trenchii TaxID=1381693 RepID=A0ABP0MX68_9DINO
MPVSQTCAATESETEGCQPTMPMKSHTSKPRSGKRSMGVKTVMKALKKGGASRGRKPNQSSKGFVWCARGVQRLPKFGTATVKSKQSLFVTPVRMELTKVAKLNLKVVAPSSSCSRRVSKNGRKRKSPDFCGDRSFQSWSSIRVFSATTRTSDKPSQRGIWDFANQVRYSCDYIDACKKFNQKPGRFLNPLAGEFFSGLPSGWTSANAGAVNKEKFFKQFPDMQPNANQGSKIGVIAMFAGCGGLELGLSRYLYPTAYVEKSDYCRKILQLRMDEGLLHRAEIHPDVCTFDASKSSADGAGGGFPCQGVSTASIQKGLKDRRTQLVTHIFRVFDTLPSQHQRFLYFENVKAILGKKQSMRSLFNYIVQAWF